ncbi:MAG: ABC transporter permease [Actinomycetota bacterium]
MIVLGGEPLVQWDWIAEHVGTIGARTAQHVLLTVIAVLIGLAISVPMGLLAYRYRRLYAPMTWITGFLYTIPSLALFVLLIPLTGLTTMTVEIGLVSYTLLILLRNVVAGLNGVPDDVKDAAAGMGLSRKQTLWRVELPLALPVIVAGVRVATVSTIGLVTVGALIGKGGLGQFILDGLQTFFNTEILVGAVLCVVLAVLAELLLLAAQRKLTPWLQASPAKMKVNA